MVMRRILLTAFLLTRSLYSYPQENRDSSEAYLLLTRFVKDQPVSQSLHTGDRVKLKVIRGKRLFGKIQSFKEDQIILFSQEKISIDSIKWIKKTKPTSENVVMGGLFAAVGVVLFIPVAGGTVDFDAIVPQGAAGLGLIIIGAIIIDPPKYHLAKGAKITHHQESN